jgi:CubicO group peptidase (beta-lactamase class C family)
VTRFAAPDAILREAVAAGAFPGATYGVLHGSEMTSGAAGRFTYEASSPEVRPGTIYDLASLTKVVATTVCAMVLVDRGQLDVDAPIMQIIPEFRNAADRRREQVTIGMLLQHNSGLPAYEHLYQRANGKEAILHAACSLPLEAIPGTRQLYSDIGFIILGIALERIADQPLDKLFQAEIAAPLGLSSTFFCPQEATRKTIPPTENDRCWRKRMIQGEVNDENASAMGGVAGHAGLFGNVPDLLSFARSMLSQGAPLVSSKTFARFTKAERKAGSYGLGWDTPSQPSMSGQFLQSAIGHLGFTGTSLWIDPQRELVIVLLSNRTWPDRQAQLIKQVRPRFHDAVVQAL